MHPVRGPARREQPLRTRTAATLALAVALAVLTTALAAVAAAPASAQDASPGPICTEASGEPRPDPCRDPCEINPRLCESKPQCSDFRDNDGDGWTDYPDDRGCDSPKDDDETDPACRARPGLVPSQAEAPDYDGDCKADLAVFRPPTGFFHVLNANGQLHRQWGQKGDIPLSGDYDGDAKTDFAVFRPSTGFWHVLHADGSQHHERFGLEDDIPVPGYYDGDAKTDIAVFRPSTGVWHERYSSNGSHQQQQWGQEGDIPVACRKQGDHCMR